MLYLFQPVFRKDKRLLPFGIEACFVPPPLRFALMAMTEDPKLGKAPNSEKEALGHANISVTEIYLPSLGL